MPSTASMAGFITYSERWHLQHRNHGALTTQLRTASLSGNLWSLPRATCGWRLTSGPSINLLRRRALDINWPPRTLPNTCSIRDISVTAAILFRSLRSQLFSAGALHLVAWFNNGINVTILTDNLSTYHTISVIVSLDSYGNCPARCLTPGHVTLDCQTLISAFSC